ncbi:hypothetical protein LBMAG15_18550 [Actinomycetes bacterium]|nr:hypothetical protein LBMAG15_18550 [Actinomycetes bacterium]
MSNLTWWLIPIGATILAVAWAAFRSRPSQPTEAAAAMENLRRLNDAMARPLPTENPSPEMGDDSKSSGGPTA